MTIDELIERKRREINERTALYNDAGDQLNELRGADSPDEAKVQELRDKRAKLFTEIKEREGQLGELDQERKADEQVAAAQREVTPVDEKRSIDARVHVGAEPRTYSRESDPQGFAFLSDVARDFIGDRGARERLARHMEEERVERGDAVARAVSTGGAPGLVVPQYLIDLYAPKGRPGRKFADQCRKHPLPDTGMTVYIPRQTAKTSVGDQASENTAVTEADYADELISVPVRTAAGSQTVSRQSVERSLGTEDIVFADLLKSYDQNLDSQLINAPAWGLLAVANTITYTDADPSVTELYLKILGAAAGVEDTLMDTDEGDIFTLMRGRRWTWLMSQMVDQWPFIATQGGGALSVGSNAEAPYSAGIRGHLPNGGDVVTDNNLPSTQGTGTDQDVIVAVARQEAHLWEDASAPLYIRAEQPSAKKLGIDLVVYGYYAACFNRVVDAQGAPKAVHQQIVGTGLIAPTF